MDGISEQQSAEVVGMLRPDPEAMRQHIEHVFGGYTDFEDGRIELAWTEAQADASGRYPLKHALTYTFDQIDELIAKAVNLNSIARTNVYIGAALRDPDTAPFGRCKDPDFYAATAYWCDLDDKDANDQAKKRWADAPPSLVVCTGEHPHWRHQLWWRLTEAVTSPDQVSGAVNGISQIMGGDGTVSNPSRVMRLAGSIAWDQKPGRRPELTRIVTLKNPGLKAYLPEHVERVFPPLFKLTQVRERRDGPAPAPGPNLGVVRERNSLGMATGKVVDGREKHMTSVIMARLIDYCGRFGAEPTADELFEHAWDAYEQSTDLVTRPGRGREEFMDKCRSTIRRFESGRIRGVPDLEAAVAAYQVKREASKASVRHADDAPAEDQFISADDTFEFLTITQIKTQPAQQWIVDGVIPEDGLAFIYGPYGAGKSFVAQDIGLRIAAGLPDWMGYPVQRPGMVLYVAAEGQAGLRNRIEAWQRVNEQPNDDIPFALVRSTINFLEASDVLKLERTVMAAAAKLGATPALIFVDTVSRAMPGADENLQKEMTLFVAACDHIRSVTGATVVGVHHAGKSGDMRGSTVLGGAGDAVLKVEKRSQEQRLDLVLTAEKVKEGEDGWTKDIRLQEVEWQTPGEIGEARKSLVAVQSELTTGKKPGAQLPDKAVCRDILKGLREAWDAQRPWSMKPITRAEGRYAPKIISTRWNVPAEQAQRLVEDWLLNDVLSVEMVDRKTKRMGLKVVGSID